MDTRMIDVITSDTIKFFRLDPEELMFLKIDSAQEYLKERFGQEPQIIEALFKHEAFWLWWRELWAQRDKELTSRCTFHSYGIHYSYPIAKYVTLPNGDGYQPSETQLIEYSDAWLFYERVHSWKRLKVYPNYQLIHHCMGEKSDEKIYVKL